MQQAKSDGTTNDQWKLAREPTAKPKIRPAKDNTHNQINAVSYPGKSQTVILGDSTVKNIYTKVPELRLISDSKMDMSDIYAKLANMSSDSTQCIILSVGYGDCCSDKVVSEILDDFDVLIKESKRVATDQVSISSICLGNRDSEVQSKINNVNSNLAQFCESKKYIFIDHSLNFTFRDGSHDASLFYDTDGEVLNYSGVSRVTFNMGIDHITHIKTILQEKMRSELYSVFLLTSIW